VHALDALHDALTPNPVQDAPSAVDRLQHLFGGWAALAALARPPEGLDAWSVRHLDRLAALESGWRDAVAGPTLLHLDVRSDNLLVTSGGVVFVDWPHACVGVPVLDLVAWAPSVALEGGPAPEGLVALSESASRVDRGVLAVLVAAFGGFLVEHSLRPPPPGLPTLRSFQAAQGEVALAWLRRLTEW
jgi:aminoglycoside phosphotransferase (APT) family kinase protein